MGWFAHTERGNLLQNPNQIKVAHYSGPKPWDLLLQNRSDQKEWVADFVRRTYGAHPHLIFDLQRPTIKSTENTESTENEKISESWFAEVLSAGNQKYGTIDEELLAIADNICGTLVERWFTLYDEMCAELSRNGVPDPFELTEVT